jgi:hypothetical protein
LIAVVLGEAAQSDTQFHSRCTEFCLEVLVRRKEIEIQHEKTEQSLAKAKEFLAKANESLEMPEDIIFRWNTERWTAVLGDVIES